MSAPTPAAPFVRPYRSHKVPACERCRHRKGRCVLDIPNQACRFCRERDFACNYVSIMAETARTDKTVPPSKRQKHTSTASANDEIFMSVSESTLNLPGFSSIGKASPKESSLMLNSHMAEDITVLERYLTGQSSRIDRVYNTISTGSSDPVVYLKVPRVRKGLRFPLDPGRTQREIIEQVLSPFAAQVRELYFDCVHPCFPILDEQIFSQLWLKDNDQISSTLVCDMYAIASLFWRRSEVLREHPRPDLHFIWDQAVVALRDDFMEPSIPTVLAALLDMLGRPVGAVTGNIVNAGRVVTLAHSLGLHRDPTSWKSNAHEKNMRIRLWWGIVIHDYFSSIGHGIPPTINPGYYDVPMVTLDMFDRSAMSEGHQNSIAAFVQLCQLTQILDNVLPCVYSLRLDQDETWSQLRKAENAMDEWSSALPDLLKFSHPKFEASVDGSSNLWFIYLSVKLLVCRLAFKATLKEAPSSSEARHDRIPMLRETSCDVVDFVTGLKDPQLQQFWLPYTSYLLVTAATILLRCTIEANDLATKRMCISKLVNFRNRLRRASEESHWDLAQFCLEKCSEPIERMADALAVGSQDIPPAAEPEASAFSHEVSQISSVDTLSGDFDPLLDFSIPFDALEFPWDVPHDTFTYL